jgi:hypothetical protein
VVRDICLYPHKTPEGPLPKTPAKKKK